MELSRRERQLVTITSVVTTFLLLILSYNGGDVWATKSLVVDYGVPGILFCFVISSYITTYITVYLNHKKYDDLKYPGPPRVSFLKGNLPTMREAQDSNTLFDMLRDWVVEHGDTIMFWRNGNVKFFTSDPDIVRSMLTEITVFAKVDAIPNRKLFGQRITGTSSFLTVKTGKLWATKRKVMAPYFTKIHLMDMYSECNKFVKQGLESQMAEVTLGETHVDLVMFYGELFQYFLGALGFDMGCGLVSKNAKFHNKAIQQILKWVPLQFGDGLDVVKMRLNPEVWDTIAHIVKLRNICQYIIDVKQDEIKEDGAKPDDIVHHVITSNSYDPDNEYDANTINTHMMDDLMTIFLVIDNMAKTLATLFVRLMRDKRVYNKVCEEVRNVDLSSLQSMDKSLKYTEMVILEVLRLHPTLMRGIRQTNGKVNLANGLTIEKNTLIFFSQLVLHKHPDYWKDPLQFYPERFETGSKNITPFTYLPFIAGPRVCMGKHLAMLSMKLSIIYSLKNHDMSPPPGQENEMEWDTRFTIVRPIKGHFAIFTPAIPITATGS